MNAIEIRDLSKSYKDFNLEHLNLTLPGGCIMGLVGENGAGKSTTDEILTFGTLEVDLGRREVKQQGKIVDLTPSEYAILITLCQNIGRPYSRLQLLNATLGESYAGYERAIDTHVSNLRKKIEPNSQKPIYILTVYGLGYKFGDHYEINQ